MEPQDHARLGLGPSTETQPSQAFRPRDPAHDRTSPAVKAAPEQLTPRPSSTHPSPLSPPRLPGTPPTNPPPRFFTRPYRRPLDPHHSNTHGSGHGNAQNSAIGVRSAFKDFVVPAQIILACSILNVIWPTLLRILTTTAEFLVLVLSSYSACARRSDHCYFLEPLIQDGQEAVYLAIVQWTLRGIFLIVFLAGFWAFGQRLSEFWTVLRTNQQRPQTYWSPQNTLAWLMYYPNVLFDLAGKAFPWTVTRGPQRRQQTPSSSRARVRENTSRMSSTESSTPSPQGITRPKQSASSPPSHLDKESLSAGSGSESKTKTKKSKRTKANDDPPLRDNSGTLSMPLPNAPSEPDSALDQGRLSGPSTDNLVQSTSSSLDSSEQPVPVSETIVDETADDIDFISALDKRRRRKGKGAKNSSATNSSEALVKPEPNTQPQQKINATSGPQSSTDRVHSSPTVHKKADGTLVDRLEPKSNAQDNMRRKNQPRKPNPREQPKEQNLGQKGKANGNVTRSLEDQSGSLDPVPVHPNPTFVHPLHALNSTSPIVRLKPTHKRSQSAQVPDSSPWSMPMTGGTVKAGQVPSLSRVHLPGSADPAELPTLPKDRSTTAQSSPQPAKDDSNMPGYDLFGQSSIWYSPFQSGLDISIDNNSGQGKQVAGKSKPNIQVQLPYTQKRSSLGQLPPATSFFESSPRTPRIMPFSQHPTSGSSGNEDWSVRARSTSIAAPMTPMLETDVVDPMDYFGGSRSANSSRRGSIESNPIESLISGRARMFAPSVVMASSLSMTTPQASLVPKSRASLSNMDFLTPHFNTSMPPLSMGQPSSTPLSSHTTPEQSLSKAGLTHDMLSTEDDYAAPAFVNPWESTYPYQSTHSSSESFLPFGTRPLQNSVASHSESMRADQERQTSLLNVMNGSGLDLTAIRPNGIGHHEEDVLFSNLDRPVENFEPSTFRSYPSVEMSLAAAANQPPLLQDDPQYDFVDLKSQSESWKKQDDENLFKVDSLEKNGKGHGLGRTGARFGHAKSASLGSFFPPTSSFSGPADNSKPGIQANTSTPDIVHRQDQGRGGSKLGRNQNSGLHREVGAVSARNRGQELESNYRGANKHHQDSSKKKATKKDLQ